LYSKSSRKRASDKRMEELESSLSASVEFGTSPDFRSFRESLIRLSGTGFRYFNFPIKLMQDHHIFALLA
jgi:hypothetical protein